MRIPLGILMLLLFGFLMCPTLAAEGARALENSSAKATTTVALTATANVSISLDSSVVMNAFGAEWEDTFSVGTGILRVSTNNPEGYSIFLGTESETTALVNTNATLEDTTTIEALATEARLTYDQFEQNTWGYSILEGEQSVSAETTYSGVSNSLISIKKTSTASDEDVYKLAFGAKVAKSLPSGQYVSNVTVSVVANPTTITNLTELVYMQDMSPTICQNTVEHVTKQLIDVRDGKKYWVAKLKDGNCWMTQNLDYVLKAGTTLTPSDTNVSSNYTVKTTTETTVPTVLSGGALTAAQYTERSWRIGGLDPGLNYVLATPTKGITCNSSTGSSTSSPNTDAYNSLRPGDTFDTQCNDIQNVTDWQPTFQAQTGTWKDAPAGNGGDASAEGLVAARFYDESDPSQGGEYDAHYLIGTYYQYNAATLGSAPASVTTKVDTTRSVCPKGWKLPTSGNTGSGSGTSTTTSAFVSKDDSFYNLLAQYGYANSKIYNWNNGNPYTAIIKGSSADNYQNNVAASPLYFVRSGHVHLYAGSLRVVGLYSYYWSATTYPDATVAYNLHFYSANVYPSNHDNRFVGLSVRCVAQ